MLKKTLNLKGVKALSNAEQKEIKGGFWGGCQPQLLQCYDDSDCPFCSAGCGITFEVNGQVFTENICAF